MSEMKDKAAHKAEELKGKAKEAGGRLVDDEKTVGEGQREQVQAKVKQAADEAREFAHDVRERVEGLAGSGKADDEETRDPTEHGGTGRGPSTGDTAP